MDDSYVFAVDHYDPSILRIDGFYVNYNNVAPVFDFYEEGGHYWSAKGYWIELMIPFVVTKVAGDDVEVTPYPASAFTEGVDYTVDGQNVTVYGDTVCKVGYLSDGKYIACPISSYTGGRHTFTVPDDIDEVVLVIKGDSDGNGVLSNYDVTLAKAASMGRPVVFDAVQRFAADISGDNTFSNYDVTLLKAITMNRLENSWL